MSDILNYISLRNECPNKSLQTGQTVRWARFAQLDQHDVHDACYCFVCPKRTLTLLVHNSVCMSDWAFLSACLDVVFSLADHSKSLPVSVFWWIQTVDLVQRDNRGMPDHWAKRVNVSRGTCRKFCFGSTNAVVQVTNWQDLF